MILRSEDNIEVVDELPKLEYVDLSDIAKNESKAVDTPRRQPLKTCSEIQTLFDQGKRKEIKHILRDSTWPINSAIRSELWPLLCRQHQSQSDLKSGNSNDGLYWDLVNQVFGTNNLPDRPIMLPQFVEANHCFSYFLTSKGRAVIDRVVSILGYTCPDITFSPCIYSICAILLHFTSEIDCYNCITTLVAAKDKKFMTQTKVLYEVTWKTMMLVAKKHVKSATQHLSKFNADVKLEKIFIDWIWWILNGLPFTHLIRIMDCFFHEGIKVMYRVAMAILILFQKNTSNHTSQWIDEIGKSGVEAALNQFIRQIPVSPSKLLRIAFGIRGLSSAYISRVFLKTEMVIKSHSAIAGSRQLTRSRSSDNFLSSQSHANFQFSSCIVASKEMMVIPLPLPLPRESLENWGIQSSGPRLVSSGAYPIEFINSLIVCREELLIMWSWLPARITMYKPTLLYTTEEHGCSLKTFYKRVQDHEQTLMIIKTFNNDVFGAYCSVSWYERNLKDDNGKKQRYFGTGETFLFSLVPEKKKYPWVGIQSDKNCDHSRELFMAADNEMITIGGGEGQAILLDENMRYGKTEHCNTFDNPPLCTKGDFQIRVLEVFGFTSC